MPVRLYSKPEGSIYPRLVGGYVFIADLLPLSEAPFADIVISDIINQFGEIPVNWYGGGICTPFIRVTDFDREQVSLFSGNPEKNKLGQVGFGTEQFATEWAFVYNSFQQLPIQKIQIQPPLLGIPTSNLEVGDPIERNAIVSVYASLNQGGQLFTTFPKRLSSNIYFDMETTVVFECIIEYVCGIGNPANLGQQIIGFYPY